MFDSICLDSCVFCKQFDCCGMRISSVCVTAFLNSVCTSEQYRVAITSDHCFTPNTRFFHVFFVGQTFECLIRATSSANCY